LKRAIRLKPDYAEAYYGLGQAYVRLGKPDLANEQLKRLNTVDPKLARKLEKELQAPTVDVSSMQSQPTTPVTTAREVTMPRPQLTVAPQTPPQTPSQTTEPASRQLQQLPPAPTQ